MTANVYGIANTGKGIYIPPGWGANWKTKLAAAQAGTGTAVAAAMGGSSTQGYYASDLRVKGWLGLLRSSLQATCGAGGSGFRSSSMTALFQSANGVPTAATNVYNAQGNLATLGGAWSAGGSAYGPGGYYVYTQASGATWTLSVFGTIAKIFTVDGGGNHANWTYSIDGGAAVTVTDSGSAQATIRTTAISGLAAGAHQVVITYAGTGSNFLSVVGIAGETTSGVIVNDFSRYGSRAGDYALADQTLATPFNAGASYPADLVIFAHGPNDAAHGDTGDTWARNTRLLMQNVRDANSNAELMIVLPNVGNFDTNYLYQDYAGPARGLAEAFGAALVDFWTIGDNTWNYWQSLGYWASASNPGAAGSDTVHPSDAGHQFIANTLLPYLAL
ncbi:SGNH/GDSL hydrolase family protein [Kitasatospora sp. NPDC094028]